MTARSPIPPQSNWRKLREAWGVLGAGFLACILVIVLSPSGQIDRSLSDRLLRTSEQAAASDILLVEISPRDIVNYGRPMLSRENLALALKTISQAGPERVLLDLHIAADGFPETDQIFEDALADLGPEKLGLVTAPLPTDLPPARFARHGTILDARLTPDADGWHRRVGRSGRENGINAARWLGTGELSEEPVPLDLRIADGDYARADVTDVIEGRVPLANRRIIISSGTSVASTRATLPRSQVASRAVVLAVAAQSSQQDYAAQMETGRYANFLLQALAIVLGILCARHASSGMRLLLLSGTAVMAIILSHMSLTGRIGTPINVVVAISCFLIMLNSTLVKRFRIAGLMSNFLRGDLSPEEAWAWRASEEGKLPAIMFAADGRVKRGNSEAQDICALFARELAAACFPRPGERAEEVTLVDEAGRSSCFRLDWPYDHVPIAILRDVSLQKAREAELLSQLHEDSLTGCLNRRGFEDAIAELVATNSDYSLLYIDLNGFKAVNDTHGHDAGDEVLCRVTSTLRASVRVDDNVARLGGDEFAIIMPGRITPARMDGEASRLTQELSRPMHLTVLGEEVSIGAAIGYASSRYDGEEPSEVIRRADRMMYDRKIAMKRDPLAA